jgi:hypothetical protein
MKLFIIKISLAHKGKPSDREIFPFNLQLYGIYSGGYKILGYILIIIQRDATQSSLSIILQVHSTCFGRRPHPSSGVHKTVTTTSGTGHIFLCSYLPPPWPVWPRWREVAAQYSMTSTGGCSYSFVYSWWWVWLAPETCRVNLQNSRLLCVTSRWTFINIDQRCAEP